MPMRQLRMVRSITRRRNSDTHHALKIFTYSLVMTCSFCSASGFVYVQHGLVVLEVSTFSSLLWKVIYPGYLSEVQKIEHGWWHKSDCHRLTDCDYALIRVALFAGRLHLQNTHHRIYHFPNPHFFRLSTSISIYSDLSIFAKIYSFFFSDERTVLFPWFGYETVSTVLLPASVDTFCYSSTLFFLWLFGNFGNDLSVHIHFNLYHYHIGPTGLLWLIDCQRTNRGSLSHIQLSN